MPKNKNKKPECKCCGAAFSHDNQTLTCRKCGISDETIAAGIPAIRAYKRRVGLYKYRTSTANYRRRKHGVPRSKGRVLGGRS